MSDLTRLDGMDASDAAAFWLVKRDQGLDVAADARFAAWLERSPAHREAWDRAETLWAGLDKPDNAFVSMRRAALAVRPDRRPQWVGAAMAAAALVVIGGLLGWRALSMLPIAPQASALRIATNVSPDYATGIGVQTTIRLPDGSSVTLDTNSAIAVRFGARQRAVRLLRGQAYIAVAHNPIAPFVVAAGDRTITDVGTQFAVAETGGRLTITLADGRVTVGGKGGPVTLQPSQQLVAIPNRDVAVSSVDLGQALAWRTGFLEFHNEPLGQAFAEMNRYGVRPVTVRDPATAALRISGRFHTGDPAQFAQSLATIYPVKLVHGPSGEELALIR